MLDQFGTINVREARLTREEVERIVAEVMIERGPDAYEFQYHRPIFLWDSKGGLTIRWPSRDFFDEPGRKPSPLKLEPWDDYVKRRAVQLRAADERAKAEAAEKEPKP